jgi:cell division protein FtsQ
VPPARRRPSTRAAALPARRGVPEVGRLLPTGRSVLVGLALLALGLGGYGAARETSLFAVQSLDVRGGTPQLRTQVRAALQDEVGRSLLTVGGGAVGARVAALPGVRSFTYDRAFPHTLRVVIRRETPVLVVRRVPGKDAFLVGASGRVIRKLANSRLSHLPRLWVTSDVTLAPGGTLPAKLAAAAHAVSAGRGAGLPGGVRTVQVGADSLTLLLGGGLQVRLGDDGDLRLKLAIARRILAQTGAAGAGAAYVDVSVPERPVLSRNSQVGG